LNYVVATNDSDINDTVINNTAATISAYIIIFPVSWLHI